MSEIESTKRINDDTQVTEELKNLFATLVRAHFLEKSPHFQSALDFERLFRLDELKELQKLEKLKELGALKELSELQELEKLDRLKELRELDKLGELDHLKFLVKLEDLKQLGQLDRLLSLSGLETLRELEKLVELRHLENLDRLKELQGLDKLGHLDQLRLLDQLEKLHQLSQLDRLTSLGHLDSLKHLEKLPELRNLERLDKLSIISLLDQTLKSHQNVLQPLTNLAHLSELTHLGELSKLEKLHELDRLEKLEKLEKLDRIEDAKFAERLDKLDKLDILKQETKKLLISQIVGVTLEVFKFGVAVMIGFLLLTSDRGQKWLNAGLATIGAGGGSRVNLGLKLVASSSQPEQLVQVLEDIRLKVQEHLKLVFTNDPFVSPRRRLEVLSEVTSYRFEQDGYELHDEILDLVKEKQKKLLFQVLKQLDFELSQAKSANDIETEGLLRELKLLIKDDRFAQAFNKAYPLWRKSEAVNLSIILSMTELYLLDPKSLGDYL